MCTVHTDVTGDMFHFIDTLKCDVIITLSDFRTPDF